jgi:hypothetical protein
MSRPVLIGSEVLVGTPLAALFASVPAALRLANERAGFLECWFAAAGLLCPLLALSIAAARGARRAARTMAPSAGVPFLVGAALWALAALPATAVLGAVLKANTHHRALAGATFAVLALLVHLGAALVAWRIAALIFSRARRAAPPAEVRPASGGEDRPHTRPSGAPARTFVALVLGAGALVLVAVVLVGAAVAEDPSAAATSAAAIPALLVDGAFVFVATAVAALIDIPAQRRADFAWLGSGALVFVSAIGLVLVGRSPSLAQTVAGRAPVAGVVAQAVGLSPDP